MKFIKLVFFGLFAFILASCFTSCFTTQSTNNIWPSNRTNNAPTSWIVGNDGLENLNLSKNEITYKDNPSGIPSGAEVNLFGKISWFNSMLEILNLQETLSFAEKESFFNALFGYIPAAPTSDFYRAVAVGGFFSDNSPLILYAKVLKPSANAPSGSKEILQFTGNFMAFRDNKTGKIEFNHSRGIIPGMNWLSNGVLFFNGLLVKASYLYSKEDENETIKEAGDDINWQYVNLADSYIKDEIEENDGKALEMLNKAYENSTDPMIKIVAKLNTFLYYLSKNDVAKAEESLKLADSLVKKSKDLDPSFLRVVEIEAQTMLKLYKNNIK
jgi:hypothetical protein